jgi:hypothetical protein
MKLADELFSYCCMSQSPWHAAAREKVRRYQDPPEPAGLAGQNLQQLADLATAVDGEGGVAATGVAAAAADDGQASKEGALAVNNGNGASSLGEAGVAKPEGDQEVGAAAVDGTQAPGVDVDVRALLREGYLNWFDEPEVL